MIKDIEGMREFVIDFTNDYSNNKINNYTYVKEKCGNTKIRKVKLVDKNGNRYEFNNTLDMCIYVKGKTGTTTDLNNIRVALVKVASGERKSAWGYIEVWIEGINC